MNGLISERGMGTTGRPRMFQDAETLQAAITAYFHLEKGEKPVKDIEAKADLTL